jgi:hypothetical protein
VRLAALALAALAATGCMSRTVTGGGSSAPAAKSTFLYVTVWPLGKSAKGQSYGLPCRGGGGEFGSGVGTRMLPNPGRACRRLLTLPKNAFAPVPHNVACTEIYGGPQVAQVWGAIRGRTFMARFSRTDGCEIARWNRLRFLFPET